MKICWGSGGIAPSFLTSVLDGSEWLVSRPYLFNSEEGAPDIRWIGSCMGPRAGLDAVEETDISFPCRESNPGQRP
jgi:hypothetical protein